MANHQARGTFGNRSRTGMKKPKGSGTPSIAEPFDRVVNFTFRIPRATLQLFAQVANARDVGRGQLAREAFENMIDEYLPAGEDGL